MGLAILGCQILLAVLVTAFVVRRAKNELNRTLVATHPAAAAAAAAAAAGSNGHAHVAEYEDGCDVDDVVSTARRSALASRDVDDVEAGLPLTDSDSDLEVTAGTGKVINS